MMNIVIGITGRAHCGKDTAARLLADICHTADRTMHTFAFGDAMRGSLRCWGVPEEYIRDPALKNTTIPGFTVSYRELMQRLGDFGRDLDPLFWLRRVAKQITELPDGDAVFVLTDVRYPNEAEWIRSNGGVIVAIERAGTPEVREHSSEQHFAALQPEHTIDNNGTLQELEAKLGALLVNLDATLQVKQAEVAA